MSLCDSDMKNQVKSMNEFPNLEKKMDCMGVLNLIKNSCTLVEPTTSTQSIARQLTWQSYTKTGFKVSKTSGISILWWRKYAILELHFGWCESDVREVLKKKNVTRPREVQFKKAIDKIEEENHAIMFLYKAERQR